jgi:hypothetical protein
MRSPLPDLKNAIAIYTKSCSDTPLKIKEELRYKSLRWKGLRRKLKRGFLEADLVLS